MGLATEQASWGVGVGVLNMIQKHNFELQVLKTLVTRNLEDILRENDYIHVLFLGFFSGVSTTGCHQKQDIKLGRYLI